LGESIGEEKITLTADNIPAHKHGINVNSGSGGKGGYSPVTGYLANGFTKYSNPWMSDSNNVNWNLVTAEAATGEGEASSTDNLQPTTFLNVMIKL
jgi:microcystin-dependent protein